MPPHLLAGTKRLRKGSGGLALLGGEVGVAGADGEAVFFPHGRDDANLELEIEVRDEPLDDRRLLCVLLPEIGAIGAHDVEELQADGRDAAEMSWPRVALGACGETLDLDPRVEALGIHLDGRRHEEKVDAGRLGDGGVRLPVARVAVEVLPCAELGRVDEDRGNHQVVLAAGRIEERDVPGVERAHRGDEPDAFPRKGLANLGDRAERPHGVFAPRSAASASASAR